MVDDEETRESLIESIEEMQVMAEATLSFAENLAGAERPQTVDVGVFLRELPRDVDGLVEVIGGPQVEVRLRPVAFRRAVRNVVENAVRYGGAANLAWNVGDEDLRIEVSDRGPGIPPEKIGQVFEPFFRLEESRSLETGGHGLGLSIARSIVRAHGGEVLLANRATGGLTASIILPLADRDGETRRETVGGRMVSGKAGRSSGGMASAQAPVERKA